MIIYVSANISLGYKYLLNSQFLGLNLINKNYHSSHEKPMRKFILSYNIYVFGFE